MKAGVYDVLVDRFADGRPIGAVPEDEHELQSIISNLNYLFATRAGSLDHLPDYGLPDITEIYRDIPDSVLKLQVAIKSAAEKYEPRLRRIRVEHQRSDPYSMRLVFLISGELRNKTTVRFETTFSSNEAPNVRPWRQVR